MLFDFKKWKNSKPWDFQLKFSWINTISTVLFCACFIMAAIREACFWFFPEYLDSIRFPCTVAALISVLLLTIDLIIDWVMTKRIERRLDEAVCTGDLGLRRYKEDGSYTGGKTTFLTDGAIKKEREYSEHIKKFNSMRKSAPPYNLDNALKSRPFEEAVCECFEDSARENSERPDK